LLLATIVVMAFAASCTVAWSQSTAQISGRLTDQSGAVMPGVEVTVTRTATGATRSAVSDETRSYTLPNLPIGPYRLEAGLLGFRTYVQTGIVLQVSTNSIINAVLEVGQVNANFGKIQSDITGTSGLSPGNQRIIQLALK